jgi:hypothetical protein
MLMSLSSNPADLPPAGVMFCIQSGISTVNPTSFLIETTPGHSSEAMAKVAKVGTGLRFSAKGETTEE